MQVDLAFDVLAMPRKVGPSRYTYYPRRKGYGEMRADQVKPLKELEKDNSRLKMLVAEQALHNSIMKEASGLLAIKP